MVTKLFSQTHFVIGCLLPGKAKVRTPCPFPLHPDFAGMMRPGHDQSTPFGLSAAPEDRVLTQRRKDAEAQSKLFWSAAGSEAPRRFGNSVRSRKAVSLPRSATAVQNPDDSDLWQRKKGRPM
jgi:hypothetical protein